MESARTQINSAKDKDESEEKKNEANASDDEDDQDRDDDDDDDDEAESIDTAKLKSFIDKVSNTGWVANYFRVCILTNSSLYVQMDQFEMYLKAQIGEGDAEYYDEEAYGDEGEYGDQ